MRDADGVILVYNPDNRAHEKEIEIWCVVAAVSMRIVAWCCPKLKLDDCTGTSSSAGKPALKIAAALHSHTRLPPAPSPARVRFMFPANVSTPVACLTAIIVCAVCFACVCVVVVRSPGIAGGEATEHQLRRARLVAHGVRQVRREPGEPATVVLRQWTKEWGHMNSAFIPPYPRAMQQ